MTSYVLNIHAMAKELEIYTNQFFEQHVASPPKLSFQDAHAIVMAVVDDAVNARMEWVNCSTETHVDVIAKIFPWFEQPENEAISERFYREIVDNIIILIGEMIHDLIPEDTWDVWDLRKFGLDAVLTQGQDYRILEWERLTGYEPKVRKKPTPVKRKPQQATPPLRQPPATISFTFALREQLERTPLIPRALVADVSPALPQVQNAENASI